MWTPAALSSEARPFAGDVWRVVEAQHRVSTMALVDTLEEQAILEALVEEVKPRLPPACAGLHWLLAAPFRYAPYPAGSRFRRAGPTEGVFYASRAVETALAETAFYRLLFLAESPQMLPPSRPIEHTAFRAAVAATAIDLDAPPLDADAASWRGRVDYAACQSLADAARAGGIGAILYASVRDPRGGGNVALLTPEAFARRAPSAFETWHLLVRRDGVRAQRDLARSLSLEFSLSDFAGDPRLA